MHLFWSILVIITSLFTFSDCPFSSELVDTCLEYSFLVQFSYLTLFALVHCIFHLPFCNFKEPLSYSCLIEVHVLNCLSECFIFFFICVSAVCRSLSFYFSGFISSFTVSNKFSLLCSSFCASCCLSFSPSLFA